MIWTGTCFAFGSFKKGSDCFESVLRETWQWGGVATTMSAGNTTHVFQTPLSTFPFGFLIKSPEKGALPDDCYHAHQGARLQMGDPSKQMSSLPQGPALPLI